MRNNRSDREPNTVFEQENFYYWCDVYEQTVSQDLDDYEREAEIVLRTVDIDEAMRNWNTSDREAESALTNLLEGMR